jgi:pimeloyl-ACP methyl ester carboxylesterase
MSVLVTRWRGGTAAEQDARALYLPTQPEATFAMLHLPDVDPAGSTGVLLCPPFGWDEVCTHRIRRAWAGRLADVGHPALRIDLPGTGDSAGSVHDAGRIEAWTASVAGAAIWLHEELGCARVVGLGIGLGGMLAWRAAAEGAPIDDLILWGTPVAGRRLVRELRGSAMLSVDQHVSFELDSDAARYTAVEPRELLDESGQLLSRETIDALGALDLTALPLPEPAGRRILLLKRSEAQADSDLEAHLTTTGAGVTVVDGDSYGLIMRYIQDAKVPEGEIARSIDWLAGEPGQSQSRAAFVHATEPEMVALDSLELTYAGVAIRETPFTLDLSSGPVRCIVSEPVDAADDRVCVVFLGGGVDRRIGPNRTWVETSRRWASRGIAAVRFDMTGIGDSAGDERQWDKLADQYSQIHVEHTIELLDALGDRGLPARFVLVGFCSGAYRSLHTALADKRVAGVFCIGLALLRWSWWTVYVRDSFLPQRPPRAGDGRLKLLCLRLVQRGIRVSNRLGHVVLRARSAWPGRADRIARRLSQRGTEVVLLLKSHAHSYEELTTPRRRARLSGLPGLSVSRLPGDDLRFRPAPTQRWVADTLDGALERVALAHAAYASVAPAVVAATVQGRGGPALAATQRSGSAIGCVGMSSDS